MTKVDHRNALAHTDALLASFSAVPASAEAVEDSSGHDHKLVTVSNKSRVTIVAFNDDLIKTENPGRSPEELKQLEEEAFKNIQKLSAQMATLPAGGWVGIAVKARRLCDYLAETGLVGPEADLVSSLTADLTRLMPEAVASIS